MTEPAADDPAATVRVERPRRVVLFAVVAVLALALDVVSKIVVVAQLKRTDDPVRILDGLFYLQQARNSGAAFSLGTGFTAILTVVALVVVVVLIRTAKRLRSTGWAVSLGLILGGALGNLGDRIFREPGIGRGHVVDWISVFARNGEKWPIFNLADSAIVVGAVLAAVLALRGVEFDGRRAPSSGTRKRS
ncbi:signal peptidase II [Jatrophihabitans fulvus]